MNRIQIINELRKYAHPSWYHSLLELPTYSLKIILDFYQLESAKKYKKYIALRSLKVGELVYISKYKKIENKVIKPDYIIIDEIDDNTGLKSLKL